MEDEFIIWPNETTFYFIFLTLTHSVFRLLIPFILPTREEGGLCDIERMRCRCWVNWKCPSSFLLLLTHHWVSFSADQRLDGAVLQRQRADGAAFAIGNIQAAPGLLRGQSQARGLGEASFVGVGIVTVFLVATSRPAQARTSLGLTVQTTQLYTKCSISYLDVLN